MLVKPLTLRFLSSLLLCGLATQVNSQGAPASEATQSLTAVRRAAEGQLRRELDAGTKGVSFAAAEQASGRCPWLTDHPYPECFVCGTHRPDGLRIFPGPVEGRRIAAAPWVPDASVADAGVVRPAVVWASVDCPSLFGYGCFEQWDALMLLGRFTAQVHRLPTVGERCVVTGWALGRDGRKHDTAAALHTADGELLALSRALWITLK